MHMLPKPLFIHIFLIATALLIGGCSSTTKQEELEAETAGMAEYQIYQEAENSMELKRYANAIDMFQQLESRFPFGEYAQQAQLELIFAYIKNLEPEAAIATADRFIRLNPQDPKVDYAYYLKGIALYEIDLGFVERYISSENADKDHYSQDGDDHYPRSYFVHSNAPSRRSHRPAQVPQLL